MKTRITILCHALALGCFALLPVVQAVGPDTGGAIAGANTGEGIGVLVSLTSGVWNTGTGFVSLRNNTTGNFNTANGGGSMFFNTTGERNTATGAGALLSNTTGHSNTSNGALALISNTTGSFNTAAGDSALLANTLGDYNTANGYLALTNNNGPGNTATGAYALAFNSSGEANTATGVAALFINTTGVWNTAVGWNALNVSNGSRNTAAGYKALINNTTGDDNTAVGYLALAFSGTGSGNVALGSNAGSNVTTANNVITIGTNVAGADVSNTCFIGNIFGVNVGMDALPVSINANGQLGTTVSSRRFKKDIKPMERTSESILALKPVTFHYKKDSKSTTQFGLIAEEVAEVNPDLVVRDKNGEIYSVRYDQVNAMLLNEFLKQHKKVEAQSQKIEEQEMRIAQLTKDLQIVSAEHCKEIEVLTAQMKKQAAQIQKVSARMEISERAPQTAVNYSR
jgi:endosialidase-like protein